MTISLRLKATYRDMATFSIMTLFAADCNKTKLKTKFVLLLSTERERERERSRQAGGQAGRQKSVSTSESKFRQNDI